MMKRLLTSIFLVITLSHVATAQSTAWTYGKWTLGINNGFYWQKSDIRDRLGYGLGATLERDIWNTDKSPIGFSLRGRYLYGMSWGKDVDRSTNIINNTALNGVNGPDYVNQNGFVYHNYFTDVHDLDLEGVLYLSNGKGNSSFMLYGFGGIGVNGYLARMDQRNFAGGLYDYSTISTSSISPTFIRNDLHDLRDGSHETYAEGNSERQWNFAPSFGLGFGWRISPAVSFAFEHKVTFPGTDLLDGNQWAVDNTLSANNDYTHYTNMTWGIGFGASGGGRIDTRVDPVKKLPVIQVINPSKSPMNTTDCKAFIMAKIYNITGIENISVKKDGVTLPRASYSYDKVADLFELSGPMNGSGSTYIISAFNDAGRDVETIIFTCGARVAPSKPSVVITTPSEDYFNASTCFANVTAEIKNVKTKNELTLTKNGATMWKGDYKFNPSTGFLSFTTAIKGETVFKIEANTVGGYASDQVTINCKPQTVQLLPPTVVITNPSFSPFTTADCFARVQAQVTNAPKQEMVTVKWNGQNLGNSMYSYNPSNGILNINQKLNGNSSFEITVNNGVGTASASTQINCRVPTPPNVVITSPSTSPSPSSDCFARIVAQITNCPQESQVTVMAGGRQLTSSEYYYIPSTGRLTINRSITGNTNFTITGTNQDGSSTGSVLITCTPKPKYPPVVQITDPSFSPHVTPNCNYVVRGTVQNVTGPEQISVTENGVSLPPGDWSYDVSSRYITVNTFVRVKSTIKIIATNHLGTAQDKAVILCKPPVNTQPKPIVSFIHPSQNNYSSNSCHEQIRVRVQNVTNKLNITVNVDGRNLKGNQFTFTGGVVSFQQRISPRTTVKVTGRNISGSASDSRTLSCRQIVQKAPPTVRITSPATSPYKSSTCSPTVKAELTNINSVSQIKVTANGTVLQGRQLMLTNMGGNRSNLTFTHKIQGSTSFFITVTNKDGSANASTIIDCGPVNVPKNPPTVKITYPATSPFKNKSCTASVKADLTYISSVNQLKVTANGTVIPGYSLKLNQLGSNRSSLSFTYPMNGSTSFFITATNKDGAASASTVIDCTPIDKVTPKPIVNITSPATNPFKTENCRVLVKASILNVKSAGDITVTVNGVKLGKGTFTFNPSTRILTLSRTFPGKSKIEITATNQAGSATATQDIVCEKRIPQPTVTITNPAIDRFLTANCNINLTAKITGIPNSNTLRVLINNQVIPVSDYKYNSTSGILTITNRPFSGESVINIVATNKAGTGTDGVTFVCKQIVTPRPKVVIVSPESNPAKARDCKAKVVAQLTHVKSRNDVSVTANGQELSGSVWTFNASTGNLEINQPIKGSVTYVITGRNSSGSATASQIMNCVPPQPKPVVTIVNPSVNPATVVDCKAGVTASVLNVNSASDIKVIQAGRPLPGGSYSYNAATRILTINPVTFTGNTSFTITATNKSGSASASQNFVCKPLDKKITICDYPPGNKDFPKTITISESQWTKYQQQGATKGQCPTPIKPVVTITNPSSQSTTVDNCQINLTASVRNVIEKSNVRVTYNGQDIPFTYSNGTVKVSGHAFTGTGTVKVTGTNSAGSANDNASFTCKPPVYPPTVTITNPSTNPHKSSTCKASITATITNIKDKSGLRVVKNLTQDVPFTYSNGVLTINDSFDEKADYVITAKNEAGVAKGRQTITCPPKVLPPTVSITFPTSNPQVIEDCNAKVTAITQNVTRKDQVNVTMNGQPVAFTFSNSLVNITSPIKKGSHTFVVKVTNEKGSASASTVIECKPPTPKPVIQMITPTNREVTLTTCNLKFEAKVLHVSSSSQIKATLNGNPVPFTFTGGVVKINSAFSLKGTVVITATNDGGSASATRTFNCPPPVKKPTVRITKPTAQSTTLENCKINLTASTTEIKDKSGVTVTMNGRAVPFTFSNNSVSVSGVSFTGTQSIVVKVSNSAGSATDSRSFTCKPPEKKITICHYPPGNRDNPQTITISENAWPAHEKHGDTKGACPAPIKPDVKITSPQGQNTTVQDCKISFTASVKNVFEKSSIKVTVGGKAVDFTFNNGQVKVSGVAFTATSQVKVTATNSSGSASDQRTFTCKPPEKKITICHYPPGNRDNPQTITISENAWPAHERNHGDTKGACPAPIPPTVNITKPTGSTVEVTDCKISVTADIKNILEKKSITVKKDNNPIDFTFSNGKVTINNVAFDNQSVIKITATNKAGSASDQVTFKCKKEDFDFKIDHGNVVPNQNFHVKITVLGCALKIGGTGADLPVMVQAKLGNQTIDPYGKYSGKNMGSNVNDGKMHYWNSSAPIPKNSKVSIKAKSYMPNGNSPLYERNSANDQTFVKVYRNGDTAPNISGFKNQADAEVYMKDHIKNGKIVLKPNEAIYLFELGTSKTSSGAYDLQDCVVLVSLTAAK